MDFGERVEEVMKRLREEYPDAPPTYLDYENPFQMTIATILSAHTTDKSVNSVTPELFKEYPDSEALMDADPDAVKEIIRPVGTYNRKTKYVMGTARMLVEDFGEEVPKTIKDLSKMPGISRKTANVILQTVFDINEGVVVDTHIRRVTQRLEFTEEERPEKIEKDLMDILPKDEWDDYARIVGAHGRETCTARSPACPSCPVNNLCPSAQLDEDQ
jgi:endonuclease-3